MLLFLLNIILHNLLIYCTFRYLKLQLNYIHCFYCTCLFEIKKFYLFFSTHLKNRIGVYRRFYKCDQNEFERRKQAILKRFAHREQSIRKNASEGCESIAGPAPGAAGDAQVGSNIEAGINLPTDLVLNYSSKELDDEVRMFF